MNKEKIKTVSIVVLLIVSVVQTLKLEEVDLLARKSQYSSVVFLYPKSELANFSFTIKNIGKYSYNSYTSVTTVEPAGQKHAAIIHSEMPIIIKYKKKKLREYVLVPGKEEEVLLDPPHAPGN